MGGRWAVSQNRIYNLKVILRFEHRRIPVYHPAQRGLKRQRSRAIGECWAAEGSLLKPMDEARIRLSRFGKARKCDYQLSSRGGALWEASRMQDHDAMVRAFATLIFAV